MALPFQKSRKYSRSLFQVSNCWYSFPMSQAEQGNREWTFLSNHGHVFIHLSRYPDSRIRDIADNVGITERSTQAILSDLEESGYVIITRIGRRNSYKVNTGLKFRHPSEASKPISSLLKIFT
jgi:predicted transcriptional regulator